MKNDTQEKSIVQINENNLFYKIKAFFKNLFHKNSKFALFLRSPKMDMFKKDYTSLKL